MSTRRTVLFSFLVSILIGSFALVLPVLGQSPSDVYITPSSGTPGTVVTLVNNNKDFSFQCSAGGAGLGTVSPGGSLSYAIPSDATAGSLIDFRCFITSVDSSDTVGVFAVNAPPPVADSDGDGLPDDKDKCPNEAASTKNGCPKHEDQPQPTQQPQQPNQPPPAPNAPPAAPSAPTSIPVVRPQLSSTGPCVVATLGATGVNIRQGPSTGETIVGTLSPSRAAPVTLVTADGDWYQIEGGWVAARVTRRGGDCSGVPVMSFQLDSAGAPTPVPVMIAHEAPSEVDWNAAFALCPEVVDPIINRLNFQGILQMLLIVDTKPDPQGRCDAARDLLSNLTFNRVAVPPSSDIHPFHCGLFTFSYGVSQDGADSYNTFIHVLYRIDQELAYRRFTNFYSQWNNPEGNGTCDIVNLNRSRIAELGHAAGINDQELLTIAVASCPQSVSATSSRLEITIVQLLRAGFKGSMLLNNPRGCQMIDEVNHLGTLSDRQQLLFAALVQQCGFTDYRTFHDDRFDVDPEMSAALLVSFADRLAVDLEGVLRHISDVCRNPLTVLQAYGYGDATQRSAAAANTDPDTSQPKQFMDCPSTYRLLERHATDLTPAQLLSILLSPQPCEVVGLWVRTGTPIPERLGAARACFTGSSITVPTGPSSTAVVHVGGDIPATSSLPPGSLVLNGEPVTSVRDLRQLLGLLNRVPSEICGIADFGSHDLALAPTMSFDSAIPIPTVDVSVVIPGISDAVPHVVPFGATEEPTAEATVDIGEPPILPAGMITPVPPFHIVTAVPGAGVTPISPSGDATHIPPSGVVTLVPLPSIATSVPPSGIVTPIPLPGGVTPIPLSGGGTPAMMVTLPSGTAVAMVPHTVDDLTDMSAALTTLIHDSTMASSASGVLGVFQVSAADNAPADLYLLNMDGVTPLTVDTPQSETLPALDADGHRIAFISTDTSGLNSLQMIDLTTQVESVLWNTTTDLTVAPYAPAWSPDGHLLLVTLTDHDGHQGIYALNLSDPSAIPMPSLVVQDAIDPAITADGDYIAYAQASGNHRDIVVMKLSAGRKLPITAQTDASQCYAPSFDETGLTLFFTCADQGHTEVYRYDLGGLKLLPVDKSFVGDTVAGPVVNRLAFSNGNIIYSLTLSSDPAQAATPSIDPLIQLEGKRVSNLRWRAAQLIETPATP